MSMPSTHARVRSPRVLGACCGFEHHVHHGIAPLRPSSSVCRAMAREFSRHCSIAVPFVVSAARKVRDAAEKGM